MSERIERTIRIVRDGETPPRRVEYWRSRSPAERLAETLKLHREGNALFRGGSDSAFVYVIRKRDAGDPR